MTSSTGAAPTATPDVDLAGLPPSLVYERLGSSPTGLSSGEAADRLLRFGANTISAAVPRRLVTRLASNFGHVMAILLWVGGTVAYFAGLPEMAVAIWVVNLVNGIFSFWQEYKAERATEALLRLLPATAAVLRDGEVARIEAADLVPGDVILIEEGDRISADGRLVEHASLRVDQSALTGESHLVRKASDRVESTGLGPLELPNMVHAGTTVAGGRGKMVVKATGAGTEFGKIAHLTGSMADTASPLQVELRHVSLMVSAIAVSVGVVFFVIALALGQMPVGRGFVFALGMIVAFVPEGLLPTVTLSLAMATQRMAGRQALVKRLSAVEALGCTTVICTDKTGTLTQNEMTVRSVTIGDSSYEFSGVGYSQSGSVAPEPDEDLGLLLATAVLASNARVVRAAGDTPDGPGARSVVGDPTEGALIVAAMKAAIDVETLVREHPRVLEIPFDSTRKRMSVVNRIDGRNVVSVKGAPIEVLQRCVSRHTSQGPVPLDDEYVALIVDSIDQMARDGLRVLGVARGITETPTSGDDIEEGLDFLGLVAMHDPPRPEVEAAIESSRRAGIRIIMITGDYGVTAEAIGRRVGMIGDGPVRVVNGVELEELDDQALQEVLKGDVVFARSTPAHKLRIVSALQASDHVVAVTGDGVNDAPALKKADIGVAMGRGGTDVAREASDIILLDDNFASIVAAIEEGRAVYDNIKKFTTYILTSNTPEAVPFVVFALSGGRIPIALDVLHILAIDLGTDLAPALALGAEAPEPDVMDRPPRSLGAHLIDKKMLARAYLMLGPIQAAFVMAAFFGAYRLAGIQGWIDLPDSGHVYETATTMALAAVVTTQIGNLFAQRSERVSLWRIGWRTNHLIWWGILSEVVVIGLIVYLPFLQRLIGTAPFPPIGWAWLLLGVPLLPLADELRKTVVRRRRRQ